MINLRRGGIAVVITGIVLHTGIDFQSVNVWVQVTHMLGIAVAEASCREALAVVVDDHRAKYYLVAAVHIYVGHAVVVVALPLPRAITVVVPAPALLQLMGGGVHVVCYHLVAGIDASGQEDARLAAV